MADRQQYRPSDSYPMKVGSQRSSGNRREDGEVERTSSVVSDGSRCDKHPSGKIDQRFGQKDNNSSSYAPSSSQNNYQKNQNTSSFGSTQSNQSNQNNQINHNTIESSSIYGRSSINENQERPHNSNDKNKHPRMYNRPNDSADEQRTKGSSKSSTTLVKFDASVYGAADSISGRSDNRNNDDNGRDRRKQPQFVKSVDADGKEIFKRKRKVPVMQKSLAIVLASLLGVQVLD